MSRSRSRYTFKSVRINRSGRRKAETVIARLERAGWQLFDQDRDGPDLRLSFRRPTRRRSAGRTTALATGVLALLTIVGVAAAMLEVPGKLDEALTGPRDASNRSTLDADEDGLPDLVERAGWKSGVGSIQTSDPDDADTDDDGLPDGLEAGLRESNRPTSGYTGVADPRKPDSDGDKVQDADEYFLDMDPASRDTDADGLDDEDELDFGSDPTRANGDGDHYSDKEEFERDSEPLEYTLTKGESAEATKGGATYGDCYECALDHGLREEQVDSVYYLAGHIGSGVAVVGDVRDLAYNLWKLKFAAAVLAGVGLVPVYGDGTKTVAAISKFAARSDRAKSAAATFSRRLPKKVRDRLPSSLARRGTTLPKELGDGVPENTVYLWKGTHGCPTYVGITNNIALRSRQHEAAGRCFIPKPIASGLTRGQARAIEEACIVQSGFGTATSSTQNLIRSIDPSKDYYDAALSWGTAYLKKLKVSCR